MARVEKRDFEPKDAPEEVKRMFMELENKKYTKQELRKKLKKELGK